MTRISWAVLGFAMMFGATGAIYAQDGKKTKGDDFFGLTKMHALHLEMSADEWRRMQPKQGFGKGRFPGFGIKKAGDKKDGQPEEVHKSAGAFGTEFPWAKGNLTVDSKTLKDVGLRFKGNFTYVSSAQMLRRPMKIDLDRHHEDQRVDGQKKLNLSNGVTDPTRSREALSFAMYRAAGVPASRTAYAELTLTVPGKYDREHVGLFTLIEQVDKTFLKAHFKNAKGLLMKPENLRGGLEYMGEDWAKYVDRYRPKDDATKEQQQRVIAFTRLIHKADDAAFRKEVGDYLDLDAFVRFLAVDALLANLDSYLGYGHNFYLYLRADTNQFAFMPWDLDLSMGMWPVGGPPQRQVDLSLDHPHIGQNKLLDRLLAMPDFKEKYRKVLRELTTTCFTKERLLKDVEAIAVATKEPLAREAKAMAGRNESVKGAFAGVVSQTMTPRQFVEKRTESVLAQLAGKRKGYVPGGGFGFGPPGGFQPKGGPPKGGPGGFGPGTALAKPMLAALDTNKDEKLSQEEAEAGARRFFKELAGDEKGLLEEKQLLEGINRLTPRPAGFPAPPKGFGFGPGNFLAGSIVRRADENKDGKVSAEEFVALVNTLFREADRGKSGRLDEAAIATAVNGLMGGRPGFGPGSFGPQKK